ncbi:MAG: adenylate kinase [Bacteroidales bacterium]|nr:adenylate kinase [Bacteroidales bacterium]
MNLNFIVFGAPCSGKGTQSIRIAERFDLIHVSTGELFRNEIKHNTKIGQIVQSYIDKGSLVPDQIVLREIYKTASLRKNRHGFVFDGFPRTLHQAITLDKSLSNKGLHINLAIYIDVENHELINRLNKRCVDSGRTDDSLDIIRKRIEIFQEQTIPLINYYEAQGKLIMLSGMESIQAVSVSIISAIEKFLSSNPQKF